MNLFKYLFLALLSFTPFNEALVVPRSSIPTTDYDVLIIGGGPAGLAALSGLARVRRKTMMLDSAEYRNGETRHMHDVIGNDGTVPAVFRYHAREMISAYDTAFMKNATVTSVVSTNTTNVTAFLTTDSSGMTYSSRKVILATGLNDVLPETPGVREAWSRGIWWCPWCDGYEHRDQPLGILGSIVDCVGSVMEVSTLNKDIIVFANGTYTDANVATLDKKRPGWATQLQGYGVAIENASITSIDRLQDGAIVNNVATDQEFDKFQINLADGRNFQRAAFMTNFPTFQHSNLGAPLGVKIYGEKMDVDLASMRTAAPGVFAVGDANSENSTNVNHAMQSGKKAAVFVHVEMEREYAAILLSKREEEDIHVRMGHELEDLWERL